MTSHPRWLEHYKSAREDEWFDRVEDPPPTPEELEEMRVEVDAQPFEFRGPRR